MKMKKSVRMRIGVAFLLCALTGGIATAQAETGVSPTTGLPTDRPYRPVLVQISNSEEARPPWGLEEADIVYETLIWAPHLTRYLAVFNGQYPEVVGSLRGARVYAAEIRQEWDCPFLFWGGQATPGTSIYDFFDLHQVDDSFLLDGVKSPNNPYAQSLLVDKARAQNLPYVQYLKYEKVRPHPHNAVANLKAIVAECWPKGQDEKPYEPSPPLFTFSDTPTKGKEAAVAIVVDYGVIQYSEPPEEMHPSLLGCYRASYTYDPETRLYERWYGAEPQMSYDGKTRVTAANVIVQYCIQEYFDGAPSRPVTQTTGSGPIDAFIDGTHIRGTWRRETLSDKTQFLDGNGNPLVLLPGKTFIQMVPPDMAITFTAEESDLTL